MIQHQLKLRLTTKQEAEVLLWLPILGKVWNHGIRKIELNARDNDRGMGLPTGQTDYRRRK